MNRPPSTADELLARHAEAAVQLSGADHTAWNGRIVELGEGILGVAHWDGTLHLGREQVLDPIRELYARSGKKQPPAQLLRYREALATLLHEQSHFLGPAGASQEAARAAFRTVGSRALDEGVAEAWTNDRLDDYITRLGIKELAPGITKAPREASYPAFVPAVRLLAEDLGRRTGAPSADVLQALNRRTAEGQWEFVVDLAYGSGRLPMVVPPDREPAVRLRLENTLRASFDELTALERLPRGFATARSRSIGTELVALLDHELAAAERFFDGPRRADRPELADRLQLGGSRLADRPQVADRRLADRQLSERQLSEERSSDGMRPLATTEAAVHGSSRRTAEDAARQALSGLASPVGPSRVHHALPEAVPRATGHSVKEETRRAGERLTGS